MNSVTINFTGCNNLFEVYGLIKHQLGFPLYFGENLDALWDLLTSYIESPTLIYIKGISTLSAELRAYMPRIVEVFEHAERQYGEIRCIVEE